MSETFDELTNEFDQLRKKLEQAKEPSERLLVLRQMSLFINAAEKQTKEYLIRFPPKTTSA